MQLVLELGSSGSGWIQRAAWNPGGDVDPHKSDERCRNNAVAGRWWGAGQQDDDEHGEEGGWERVPGYLQTLQHHQVVGQALRYHT